ncbi:MAG: hypothetical protein V7641_174 [Blastocatellia bacterium]
MRSIRPSQFLRIGSVLMPMILVATLTLSISSSVRGQSSRLMTSGRLWVAYSASTNITALGNIYDLKDQRFISDIPLSPPDTTPPNGNVRGLAYDPTDDSIWYSTLRNQAPLGGDGLIHKKPKDGSPEVTIPDPGGVGGPGIGALDYDAEENVLWAATNFPVNNQTLLYKLNPTTGAVLKTLALTIQEWGGGVVLAVARPADLGGDKVILTNAGEADTSTHRDALLAVDMNSGAVRASYPIHQLTAIDVDEVSGDLLAIYGHGSTVHNLGYWPTYDAVPYPLGFLNIEDKSPVWITRDMTLDAVTPVIFIPGIAGSVLTGNNNDQLWPGLLQNHSRLTLDPQATRENITAIDALRSVKILNITKLDFYRPLLNKLTTSIYNSGGGYEENDLINHMSQCDSTTGYAKSSLFVFPYDWRKSNAENAVALANFVTCVQQHFSPTHKVNLLAHSMGGLLARRYILDHPGTHQVNKLITMGTPWLGAPKAYYGLETGDMGLKVLKDQTTKELLKFFPGAHELLPSAAYFTLGGRPFEEMGVDIDGNRVKSEVYGTYNKFISMIDKRFPYVTSALPMRKPGTSNSLFHATPGQDDWRNDQTGVQYYQFLGRLPSRSTIEKITAVPGKECDHLGQNCVDTAKFKVLRGFGDETVPLLSAERRGNGLDFNAPNAIVRIFQAEHLGLTQNGEVQNTVLEALRTTRQFPLSGPQQEPKSPQQGGVPAYYLTVDGVDSVTVTDHFGNSNEPIGDTLFRGDVPGVTYDSLSEKSYEIIMPWSIDLAVIDFTITFRTGTTPIFVQLLLGDGTDAPGLAKRYRDLNLPPGVMVQLKISEFNGIEDLRYDADGDGTFETIIPPTVSVEGDAALDATPPVINISGTYQQNTALVAITATDNGSGLQSLRYSLDGTHYQPYTEPFTVNLAQSHAVYAIADDNVANREVEELLDLRPALAPTSQFILVNGGDGTVELTAPPGFNWTAISNDDWIILTSARSGSGSYFITFEVRDNSNHSARTGTINIAGLTYTVIQAGDLGGACSYALSATFTSVSGVGGAGTISVFSGEHCAWQAVSNVSWIMITSGNAGIGNGVVTYSVAANPGTGGRAGTITIGGKTFSVKQNGSDG